MPGSRLFLVVLAVLVAGSSPAMGADDRLARVTLTGESATVGRRLAAVRQLVAARNYTEALPEYQRLLDASADDLMPLDAEHCVAVRWVCHRDLAALPAEGLQAYRTQADGPARKLLDEGLAKRDEALLRRVVAEAFCSRPAAVALESLGDLAFERGSFAEAERWWRLLIAPASEREALPNALSLVYPPGPEVDAPRLRAKQLLAQLVRGERTGFAAGLAGFRELHGKAEGSLAGRTGNYGEILQALARGPASSSTPTSWPTFGGSAARDTSVSIDNTDRKWVYQLCRDGPRWRFDLETHARVDQPLPLVATGSRVLPPTVLARQLAFHPVVVDEKVLVADARSVTAYDVRTGRAEVWYDLGGVNRVPAARSSLPAPPHLSYTLTVAEGHVLARLGAQELRDLGGPPGEGARPLTPADADTFLVCLSLRPDRQNSHVVWTVRPAPLDNRVTVFEGTPIVRDGRVYVAVTRYRDNQSVTAIHCYPLHTDHDPTPPLLWKQDVCAVQDERGFEPRYRHHLLTLAGPNLVYASHSGAIVAVDALTGRHAWARRYASRGTNLNPSQPSPRDLAPCLYAGGRLYVAPLDTDRLLCLDPDTGRLLWERERVEAIQLLGVGSGRLIFTMWYPGTLYEAAHYAIRAVDAATGGDEHGWVQPGDGSSLATFGRGLLLGDLVLWPTERGLRALRQDTGEPPTDLDDQPLRQIASGNLAYVDGCLAVAGTRELTIYVAASRLGPEPERPTRDRATERVEAIRQLAEWWTAIGRPEQAARLWQSVLEKAELRRACLTEASGRPISGAQAGEEALQRLIERYGAAVYLPIEERAGARLRRAHAARHLDAMEELLFQFPHSAAACEAARHLAAQGVREGRPGVSASACRFLLRHGTEEERPGVLGSLAVAYEQQGCLEEARAVWEQLARSYPDRRVPELGPDLPVRDAVAHRLRRAPSRESVPSTAALAYEQVAHLVLDWDEVALKEGNPGEREFFTVRGRSIVCRERHTGNVRWTTFLPCLPVWLARRQDLVLAAGEDGLAALRLEDGRTLWQWLAGRETSGLSAFQVADRRLFCFQARHRLLAFDAETGYLLWQTWAPAGRLNLGEDAGCFAPAYAMTPAGLVIQTSSSRYQTVASATGRVINECSLGHERPQGPQWRQPIAIGKRLVCALPDAFHLVVFDPSTGYVQWKYDLELTSTLGGRWPQLIGAGGAFFVLIERNFGMTLQRFDPVAGKVLWSSELYLGPQPVTPDALTADTETLYCAAGRTLRAWSLADHRLLWEQPLTQPAGTWRVLLDRSPPSACLIVFRDESPVKRFRFRWLFGTVQWMMVRPSARDGFFGFARYDCRSGRLVERRDCIVEPEYAVRFREGTSRTDHPEVALSATGGWATAGREVWLYAAQEKKP